jgi:chorismate dehydratase
MSRTGLRIGRIPYVNLFPFFYYLETRCDNSFYRFINGHPSRLNRMLREGLIDISPSSSIEYLKNKDIYSILPFLSISSEGRIDSILLFSKYPLDELDGQMVTLSSDSDTSVVLLKIILKEFEGLRCNFRTVNCRGIKNPLSISSAVLLIGDTAMKEAKRLRQQTADREDSSIHIYDLGELWHKHTGLPFVFALWIVRNESLDKKEGLVKRLSLDLYNAREYASRYLGILADSAPQRQWLSKRELVEYWENISYELTERHIEGLTLFERYAIKHHLIKDTHP